MSLPGLIDNGDGTFDVKGDMDLSEMKLKRIPIQFRNVGRDFYCSDNSLTSLEGAPSSVGGGFSCSNNSLTSLEGAPSSVGGSFYCSYNSLTSLKGAPSSVGGGFYCYNNKKKFTEAEVRAVCDVKGEIIV